MLKTWKFWKTFFTTYFALVAGIWGVIQIYSFFREDELKQLFNSNWLMVFYVIPLFIAFSVAIYTSKEETQTESLDQRNRRVMLDHVENFWLKGVLEKSLHGVALLELGIKEDLNAVNYPWGIKKASTNETLPSGKSMLEIFKEIGLGRSLLILGAPGSGKTTMLLELTRQLIEIAQQDENEPIPVFFNLSSWTEKLSLADWLVEQLNIFYYVPKKTAQKLLTDNRMLLLLDGLDEVKADQREKCVEAINQFKTEHGLTSLAICSRIEEYQAIQTKLELAGAITLQPLTSEQVDSYFDKFGKSLSSLKQMLKKDKTLRELTETPLMLSIMVLAYKDVNIKDIPELKNSKEQRKYLFDTYINRMFERSTRSEKKDFSKEETLHYLSWLAYQMVKQNLITYQIEAMQPLWLDDDKQHRSYKLKVKLSLGIILGLFFGFIGGVSFGRIDLVIGVLILLLSKGLIGKAEIEWGLESQMIGGVIGGFIVGLIIGLIFGQRNEDKIKMIDKLRWDWKAWQKWLIGGLIFGLLGWLSFDELGGLTAMVIGGLIFGLTSGQIEETTHPGQRLKQTRDNAISVMVIGGLVGGLIGGLIYGMPGGLIVSPAFGLLAGLSFGLPSGQFFGLGGGLIFGIGALIQHYTLRSVLIKNGYLPQSLFSFLESCVDLIFLRRVGGSYIFVHRLLMEHFAEMNVEKENK